jgi:hypothetical protein
MFPSGDGPTQRSAPTEWNEGVAMIAPSPVISVGPPYMAALHKGASNSVRPDALIGPERGALHKDPSNSVGAHLCVRPNPRPPQRTGRRGRRPLR